MSSGGSSGSIFSKVSNTISKVAQGAGKSVVDTASTIMQDIQHHPLRAAEDLTMAIPVGGPVAVGKGIQEGVNYNMPQPNGQGTDTTNGTSPTTTPPPAPPPETMAGGSSTTATAPIATNPAGNVNPAPDIKPGNPAYTTPAANPTVEVPDVPTGNARRALVGDETDDSSSARKRLTGA